MVYLGIYMTSWRVSSPMFDPWKGLFVTYVLCICAGISIYKAVKKKTKYWLITSIFLISATFLFTVANIIIASSPRIPSSTDEGRIVSD